jgi:hypothetical protein
MGVLVTNETVKQLFHIAQSIAKENYNGTYGGPHILQALITLMLYTGNWICNIKTDKIIKLLI